MSQPLPSTIISHWYNLIENFTYSSQTYYGQITEALVPRQIPDIKVSYVEHPEEGVFSAKRIYLRVQRGRFVFDICGAPFGTGFFVSWWLGELRGANIFVVLGALLGFFVIAMTVVSIIGAALTYQLGFIIGSMFVFLSIPAVFLVMFLIVKLNPMGIEDTIIEIPYIGPVYERLFRPTTYYKIDTALMFQSAVHTTVMQVVDEITKEKGLKALSEDQRKPIMREFYQR